MHISPAAALSTSLLLLLAARFLFGMTLSHHQSRKAQKRYRADVPFWKRWFLLSAPDYVRDKYSKLEKKIIKSQATIRALRAMNILLHILLAAEALVILVNSAWASAAFTVYFVVWGACVVLEGIIEWQNRPNFERMRHGRKPPNW